MARTFSIQKAEDEVVVLYWVAFDAPADDGNGDGPYNASAIEEENLELTEGFLDMPEKIQTYQVVPHVSVGPVLLGMRRDQVHAVMGKPHRSFRKSPASLHETDAFGNKNGFQVFYGGNEPTVEYIELSRNSGFEALFDDVDVFAIEADELVDYISMHAPFDSTHPELGYSYFFPDLELSVWRPIVPEEPSDTEGRYFSTIGIGVKGYYSGKSR